MKPVLIIGTPVIRPWNLSRVYASLKDGTEHFDLSWWIALDAHRLGVSPALMPEYQMPEWVHIAVSVAPGNYGERHLNAMLDALEPEFWFCGVADDTLVAPGFFERLAEVVEDADARAVMFRQKRKDGFEQPAKASLLKAGEVDGGQCVVRKDLVGDLRYADGPTCDGEFFEALYRKDPGSWRFVDEPLTLYNALR